MTLPNFLGLGVQRSGTSWLHENLLSHPDIYLPQQRKEVHYFDQYFERGPDWYRGFFPTAADAGKFNAIGEITPRYFFEPLVPARIQGLLPDVRFILILRNPADRLFSQFLLSYGTGRADSDFQTFIQNNKTAFARGLYADQLERYLELFSLDKFKILIFEEVFENKSSRQKALIEIARFLGLDPDKYPVTVKHEKINAGHGPPKSGKAFKKALKLKRWLRDHDMDFITNSLRKSGIKRAFFGADTKRPELSVTDKQKLLEEYQPSIERLEKILGRNMDVWLKS